MIIAATTSSRIGFNENRTGETEDLLGLLVKNVLHSSAYEQLRKLQCEVNDGVVTLSGAVQSFYLKQMAQEAVIRLDRVRNVINRVEVRRAAYTHIF
jgi:osmotically-inducible protein OsmY